jgi:hypothetical protein
MTAGTKWSPLAIATLSLQPHFCGQTETAMYGRQQEDAHTKTEFTARETGQHPTMPCHWFFPKTSFIIFNRTIHSWLVPSFFLACFQNGW